MGLHERERGVKVSRGKEAVGDLAKLRECIGELILGGIVCVI